MDHVPLMDRDNIAILALLCPRYMDGSTCNNTVLCVANTHLLFNKNRGEIKLLQLASLFAEIDQLKKEFIVDRSSKRHSHGIQKIPVLLCGDFNMTPCCPLYQYISKGFLNYEQLSKKELSGQNFTQKYGKYRTRDAITANIIPQEMGLTSMSTWDIASAQGTSQTSEDDYGFNDSGRHGYNAAVTTNTLLTLPQHAHIQPTTSRYHSGANPRQQSFGDVSTQLPQPPLDDRHCLVIRHRLYFWSVYRHMFPNQVREVTTYHGNEPSCTVDYIFDSPGRDELCHTCRQRHGVMELTGSLNLLSEEEVSRLGGLPSPILSSDHLALVASFALHI